MDRGSSIRVCAAIAGLLLFLSPVESAALPSGPSLPNDRCEESPSECVAGKLFALLMAPFTHPFSAAQASYRTGDPTGVGLRFERSFRGLGPPRSHTHPLVGIGWRATVHPRRDARLPPDIDHAFEAALGYQWALVPTLTVPTPGSALVWTAETQYLGGHDASLRSRTGPGLVVDLDNEQRLRVHLTVEFALAGTPRRRVRPGVGVSLSWK
jgi:hypothetical protein